MPGERAPSMPVLNHHPWGFWMTASQVCAFELIQTWKSVLDGLFTAQKAPSQTVFEVSAA